MFRHHLLLIYRNFKRYKSSFLINLFGLSAGLCCALMIYLWVADELAIDKFHANNSRLFQVMENEKTEAGINTSQATSGLLAESLAKDVPEIAMAATATPTYWLEASKVYVANGRGIKAAGKFVGEDFLKVFFLPPDRRKYKSGADR
jgi:putative ABC transport system permease protein